MIHGVENMVSKLVLIILVSLTLYAKDTNWTNSIEAAIKRAQTTKTPIMVFVYSDTCHYCSKSIKDFQEPNLNNIINDENKITMVAVNKNDLNQLNKYQLQVNMYPTYFLLSSGGRKISEPIKGYIDVDNMKLILNKLIKWYKKDVKEWYENN